MCSAVKLFTLIASPIDLTLDPELWSGFNFLHATGIGRGRSLSTRSGVAYFVGFEPFDDKRNWSGI
jgi:hypothetical protein